MFPSDTYSIWIRYRDQDIYDFIVSVYTNTDPSNIPQDEIEPMKAMVEDIWNNVLLINKGLNNRDLNFLLFTHLLILNSEYMIPVVFKKYGIENKMATPFSIISSTSDGSTSVSSQIVGADNLSLDTTMYLSTKWGYMYITLLQQIQSLVVVL